MLNPTTSSTTSVLPATNDRSEKLENAVSDAEKNADNRFIIHRLKTLAPWRMAIQITPDINTASYLGLAGSASGCRQRRLRAREQFVKLIDKLYVDGFRNKRFLDCGCNAGGYCFWIREQRAELAYGFDVRAHWIQQARFVKARRTVDQTDRIQFEVNNLFDLPKENLDPFDLVYFKDLFNYLSDPINGLKIAGDLSRDVIVFATAALAGVGDDGLRSEIRQPELLHGGIDPLTWIPTGPGICGELIKHLGFEDVVLTKARIVKKRPDRQRIEIVAAREKGRLNNLDGVRI